MAYRFLGRAKKVFTEVFDLPQDITLDLPRITMIGKIHIYIENHRGVLTFSDSELRLQLKQGQLLVKGKGFVLKMMLPDEILLQGEIEQVIHIDEVIKEK